MCSIFPDTEFTMSTKDNNKDRNAKEEMKTKTNALNVKANEWTNDITTAITATAI